VKNGEQTARKIITYTQTKAAGLEATGNKLLNVVPQCVRGPLI